MVQKISSLFFLEMWYFEYKLPTGDTGQILDIFDYLSNNIMMPILAILTCVLVGWVIGPKEIIQEAEEGGAKMGRRALYVLMIRFVCIVLLTLVFMKAFGFFG